MSLTNTILTNLSAGITQLKNDPMKVMEEADGAPVAILNRNKPAFYAVPCALFEQMIEQLEDIQLNAIADAALDDETILVNIDEL